MTRPRRYFQKNVGMSSRKAHEICELGTLLWFDKAKGYGFIQPSKKGLSNVFVHGSDILTKDGKFPESIDPGTKLEYTPRKDEGQSRYRAHHVTLPGGYRLPPSRSKRRRSRSRSPRRFVAHRRTRSGYQSPLPPYPVPQQRHAYVPQWNPYVPPQQPYVPPPPPMQPSPFTQEGWYQPSSLSEQKEELMQAIQRLIESLKK